MSTFDLSGVVESLFVETIVIERRGATTRVDGDVVEPLPTKIRMRANVQPASPRDLSRLPEGDRTGEVILVLTAKRVRTGDLQTKVQPDVVCYDRKRFEVLAVEDWSRQSGQFETLARKVEGS